MANLTQTLTQKRWVVQWADTTAAGELAQYDVFQFQPDLSIQRVSSSGAQVPWAGPCTPAGGGVKGVTTYDQRGFQIDIVSPTSLSCTFAAPVPPRPRWAILAASFVLGTAAGALAGAATGSLRLGVISGAAAAATSSFFLGARATPSVQTGPSATMAVDDGSHGPVTNPGHGHPGQIVEA